MIAAVRIALGSLALAFAAVVVAWPARARAYPRPLPFTFLADTLAPGDVELQQWTDLTPLRELVGAGREPYLASALQVQLSIGVRDRVQLDLAATFAPGAGGPAGARFEDTGAGLRQRVTVLLAEPREWPIDVALVGELTENERAFELEVRLVAQLAFDRLRLAVNVGAEHAWYYAGGRDLVATPSVGATFEVSARLELGVEGWLRRRGPYDPSPAARTYALGPQVYAGPTALVRFGKAWWAIGAYHRLTDLDHELAPGDPYGGIWVRSMIGVGL